MSGRDVRAVFKPTVTRDWERAALSPPSPAGKHDAAAGRTAILWLAQRGHACSLRRRGSRKDGQPVRLFTGVGGPALQGNCVQQAGLGFRGLHSCRSAVNHACMATSSGQTGDPPSSTSKAASWGRACLCRCWGVLLRRCPGLCCHQRPAAGLDGLLRGGAVPDPDPVPPASPLWHPGPHAHWRRRTLRAQHAHADRHGGLLLCRDARQDGARGTAGRLLALRVLVLALTFVQCYTLSIYWHIYCKGASRAAQVSDDAERAAGAAAAQEGTQKLLRSPINLKYHHSAAF